MSWTVLVPLKAAAARKSRLSDSLSREARVGLSETLFRHLLNVLARCPDVGRVAVLSHTRPDGWPGLWIADQGRGLNPEVRSAARAVGEKDLLVIHADLPAVSAGDIAALICAAEDGVSIAPDRHGAGTNAIALADASGFPFAFGPDSFKRHGELAGGRVQIVLRPGLALDIDTPSDVTAALSLGDLDPDVAAALTQAAEPPTPAGAGALSNLPTGKP